MNTLNLETGKLLLAGICCLLLTWTSCSDEAVIGGPAEGEIPITIQAEISTPENDTRAGATAEDPANAYDRSSFIADDMIRVTRTYNGTKALADYKLTDGKWIVQGSNPLSLRIGATYQAVFPSNYNSITPNQSTKANYLASNLLKTPDRTSSSGELDFTGDNAFAHQNTKITLVFSGAAGASSLSGTFSGFTVSGNGLYTGKSDTKEIMYFYRPSDATSTWCGIVYPKDATAENATGTEITLSLTYDKVKYNATIECPMVAGKHYKFNLTIHNNILVSDGMTIEGWKNDDSEGDHNFDTTT